MRWFCFAIIPSIPLYFLPQADALCWPAPLRFVAAAAQWQGQEFETISFWIQCWLMFVVWTCWGTRVLILANCWNSYHGTAGSQTQESQPFCHVSHEERNCLQDCRKDQGCDSRAKGCIGLGPWVFSNHLEEGKEAQESLPFILSIPQKPWFGSGLTHFWDHLGGVQYWGDGITLILVALQFEIGVLRPKQR